MTNDFGTDYDASSRGYLGRARQRMRAQAPESRIYAALELRSGIEARCREYLEVWDHISQNSKTGWQLSALWKDLERAFNIGDKVVEVTVIDPEDRHDVRGVIEQFTTAWCTVSHWWLRLPSLFMWSEDSHTKSRRTSSLGTRSRANRPQRFLNFSCNIRQIPLTYLDDGIAM